MTVNLQMAFWYIVDRLKERSTWLSIGTALTGAGVTIRPDKWQLIMGVGMIVPGIITAFMPPRIPESAIVPAGNAAPTTAIANAMVDKVTANTTAERTS